MTPRTAPDHLNEQRERFEAMRNQVPPAEAEAALQELLLAREPEGPPDKS